MNGKQVWERVSKEAKEKKLRNKKSKRDILREESIKNLGGSPIEVIYGVPLSDTERFERKNYLWDLQYPNRHKEKEKQKVNRIPNKRGAEREEIHFRRDLLFGARARAKANNLPFNLEISDIIIPKVCPVLGIDMCWGDKLTGSTPTIDRLVPSVGYVKGNIKVISHKANRYKNCMSLEEAEKVLVYMRKYAG